MDFAPVLNYTQFDDGTCKRKIKFISLVCVECLRRHHALIIRELCGVARPRRVATSFYKPRVKKSALAHIANLHLL